MDWAVWLAIGAVGAICLWIVLQGAFIGGVPSRIGLIVSIIGVIVWALFALNAFDVTTVTGSGCCVIRQSYTSLGYLGFGISLIMLIMALKLTIVEAESI